MQRRLAAALLTVALAAAACGASATPAPSKGGGTGASANCPSGPNLTSMPAGWGVPATSPTILPVLINPTGELTCGSNRLLWSFVNAQNLPAGAPDRTAKVTLYNLSRDASKAVATLDGTFIWAIEGSVGVYTAPASFDQAGIWGAEMSTTQNGKTDTTRVVFQVVPTSTALRPGDKAPSSKTPTGDPKGISTDAKPDPRLYATSIDQALARKVPFLVAFATPKFCTSGQCGPTLERVKPFVDKYPTVTFINVEPYELKADAGGQLQPVLTGANLTPTKATTEWGLLSEPWIYVVNREGVITASLALIFSDQELAAALDAVK